MFVIFRFFLFEMAVSGSMLASCHTLMKSRVTRQNESCHTYEWVMSHVTMSMSHIRMSHVTRKNESWTRRRPSSLPFRNSDTWRNESVGSHTLTNHATYEWSAHMDESCHVTRRNKSSHTYDWVMSHTRMSHGPEEDLHHFLLKIAVHDRMNQSGHVHSRVMPHMNGSHTWMSHVTHKNESRHTYELFAHMDEPHVYGWIMLRVWTSHVTYMNSHVTRMNESYDANKRPASFSFPNIGTWQRSAARPPCSSPSNAGRTP